VAEPASAALASELAAAIAAGSGTLLGSGYQASVHLHETSAGPIVVKVPHGGGPLGRLWRALLEREAAVYERLAHVPGVPRAFGIVGDRYLALQYVEGPSLREYEARIADREAFFGKLRQTLEAMHAAGVAHGDLKRKDNVIVAAGEEPYLVDFGIATRRSECSLEPTRLRTARPDGPERVGEVEVRATPRSRLGRGPALRCRRRGLPAAHDRAACASRPSTVANTDAAPRTATLAGTARATALTR
jgi:predicted Ser/Thr protein kinase